MAPNPINNNNNKARAKQRYQLHLTVPCSFSIAAFASSTVLIVTKAKRRLRPEYLSYITCQPSMEENISIKVTRPANCYQHHLSH